MTNVNLKALAMATTLAGTLSLASAQSMEHTARIPAASDMSSILFQSAKIVTVPVTYLTTDDARYCRQAALREPGGSMYCGAGKPKESVRAYELTYSYTGQPLASDEYGNKQSMFRIYFPVDELSPADQALLNQKHGRSEVAESFQVTATRELQPRVVIDATNSALCSGTYVDGTWARTNDKCHEDVRLKTATVASDYVTVRVERVQTKASAE